MTVWSLGQGCLCRTIVERWSMHLQEISRELKLKWHGARFIYCGRCAVKFPADRPHRIALAGGKRFAMASFNYLWDYLGEPGALSALEYVDPDPQVLSYSAEWWKTADLRQLPTGALFEIVRNAPRLNYTKHFADTASRHAHAKPAQLQEIADDELGLQRSTASSHHLSLGKREDDEMRSLLICSKCETSMRVDRVSLMMAVEHLKAFGGVVFVSPSGVEIRESRRPFNGRRHFRSSRGH